MINFQNIEIEGFGSIQNLNYPFKSGLYVIKAENGVGKTTILNAWFWSLTGETLKPKCSINTWSHLQPPDYKGTKVINNFHDGYHQYQIIRCQEYQGKVDGAKGNNRLIIKRDGDTLNYKKKAQAQEALFNILGYSADLLKNTVVFGQKLKRLIDESGTNKKDILEEAFEMTFIQQAQDKAKKKKQEKISEYTPSKLKLETLLTTLRGKKELLSQALENEEDFNQRKQNRLKILQERLNDQEKSLELHKSLNKKQDLQDIKKQIFKNETQLTKYRKQEAKYDSLNRELNNLTDQIEELTEDINDLDITIKAKKKKSTKPIKYCDRCGQAVKGKSKDQVKKGLKEDLKQLTDKYEKLSTQQDDLLLQRKDINRQLTSLKEVKQSINTILTNNKKLEKEKEVINKALSDIAQYEKNILDLQSQIKETENEVLDKKSTQIKLEIRKIKKKIKPIRAYVKEAEKDLEVIEWLIKDPLSNSGLKAFIFNDMIHLLNERMAHYSQYFGFKVEFEVDMESARKDIQAFIFQDGEIIPYEDLSGGQAQFVAVVMAFGLHDIVVKGKKTTNILLIDEIFEGLSKNNIEKVTEIIKDKLGNLSVNLVTHRNEFNPYNSNIIRLRMVNGHTLVESAQA